VPTDTSLERDAISGPKPASTVVPGASPPNHENPLRRRSAWLGLLFALLLTVALFTQFSIDDRLSRDEAVYAYGGQQLAAGVPYYVSIFDAKTPLSPMLAGAGVATAKALGADDVYAVRIVFLLFACADVIAVYLLALWLWGSVLAGVVSAAAFVSYKGFAVDALGGPDAKTPGVAFAVISMVLLVRRRWLWAGATGALAFLVWQPLGVYAAVAVVAVLLGTTEDERRGACARALAGAAIPIAGMVAYYWVAGALPAFVDGAVRFPLDGVHRTPDTPGERVSQIIHVVHERYGALHGTLLWGGLAALVVLVALGVRRGRSLGRIVRDPLVCVVMASLIPLLAFTVYDFQGYPDMYPMLPYAALGVGGAWALVVRGMHDRRSARAVTVIGLAAVAVLSGFTWEGYSTSKPSIVSLKVQRARAAAIERILGPRGTLYAIGDPTPLVLTHRRNPSRYIYLGSGVFSWMTAHTPGGFAGWEAQVLASDPSMIVVHTYWWHGSDQLAFARLLRRRYETRWMGAWQVLVKAPLLKHAAADGLVLSKVPGGA
jgi:hypothetical protein